MVHLEVAVSVSLIRFQKLDHDMIRFRKFSAAAIRFRKFDGVVDTEFWKFGVDDTDRDVFGVRNTELDEFGLEHKISKGNFAKPLFSRLLTRHVKGGCGFGDFDIEFEKTGVENFRWISARDGRRGFVLVLSLTGH